jgi:GAF domain-containing protein
MLQAFQRFLPKPRSDNPELARQESLLYLVLIGLGGTGLCFALASLFTVLYLGGGPLVGFYAGIAACAVYVVSFLIARVGGQVRLAAYLPVAIVFLIMVYGDYSFGMGHVTYIGYAMATVAAGILIGTNAGILFAFFSMVMHTGIGLLQNAGVLPLINPASPASTIWLDSAGLGFGLILIVIISAIYNSEIRSALNIERELGDELRIERERLLQKSQEAQRLAAQYMHQMRTVAESAMAAGAERRPLILMQSILDLLHQRLDLAMGGIFLLDESGQQLLLKAATSDIGQQILARGRSDPLESASLVAQAARAKRIVLEGHLNKSAEQTQPSALAHVQTELAIPMLLGDRCVGVLDLLSVPPDAFDEAAVMMAHSVAQIISHGLELANLASQVGMSQEEIRGLNRRYMADAWGNLENLGSDLSFSMESGESGSNQIQVLPSGMSETNRLSGSIFQSTDGLTVTAPLILHEQVIGALTLQTESKPLLADDLTFIEAVTTQATLALENARLYTELTRRATYLQTANEIARDASTTLDLNLLLRRVVDLICERFGFSHAAVYLMEEDSYKASVQAATGSAGSALLESHATVSAGPHSVVGHALSSGNHYAANIVDTDPFFTADPLLPETRSELAIPLRVAGQIIGVLDIHSAKSNAFGENEINILQTLSGQVAVAVQNARLFAQVSHRAERERKVVEITSRIRSTNDISTILQTAVGELRRAFGISNATVTVGPMAGSKREESGTSKTP